MSHQPKQFKPTSWAINNKTSVFIFTIILIILGISTYNSLPKESFPDIVIPTIIVNTTYGGTSPTDMENLVTRHIEKQIKGISGIKKITSTSVQNFSIIVVEFNTDVDVTDAKNKVKDAVDKAKPDLPSDLIAKYGEPAVTDINFAEFPMMNINLSGDFELSKLKKYADDLKDRIEEISAVNRVDEIGAPEREIQINMDLDKMNEAKITFDDVSNAIQAENQIVSGGEIPMNNMKRSIKVDGEFTSAEEIADIPILNASGNPVYLKDIADVRDTYKDKESYARLDGSNVLTLNVIKRSGENLVQTSDKVRSVVDDMQKTKFPSNLRISITSDQSTQTRSTLNDLINTIIIGFVLVTIILMFFMGTTNAIFVGLSVPLSIFIAFLIMPTIGFSLNMIVLFSLLFALGIVVDDAIVVIENTWRIFNQTKLPVTWAAKYAAGEVFIPVLAGTLTTLSPFIPLTFWPGIIGKFMVYLPITLILTLLASLIVAYIINPVFAVQFMKRREQEPENGYRKKSKRNFIITIIIFIVFALIFYAFHSPGLANFTIFLLLLVLLNKYVLTGLINRFQKNVIPRIQNGYTRIITWALKGGRPYWMLAATVILFFFSIGVMIVRKPQVELFPTSDPNFIFVYMKLPVGTDVKITDSVTRIVEKKVFDIVGKNNPMVDAVIANVGLGAGDANSFTGGNATPNQGKVTVAFKEYKYRNGVSTVDYLNKIRSSVKSMPGVEVSVDQEQGGPPTGKPVNIEISGDDYGQLIATSENLRNYLDSVNIPGIENLKSDVEASDPEILVNVDREAARRTGISTGQIGQSVRTAVYGDEVSKYREYEDEYPIMLRYDTSIRHNIDQLVNMKIQFMDQHTGELKQIPLSSVATLSYQNTLGAVTRINLKRVITLSSNVTTGYTPNTVNALITQALKNFPTPESVTITQTGQSEDEQESSNFLGGALLVSLALIFLILVTLFNSFSKPVIILSEIIFSVIGVFLGFGFLGMKFSIIMNGIGIIGLAGIVVRNGILLVEFADELKSRGLKTREAIIQAGRIRMTPVLLTAGATMLGLLPLAVGFNINFVTLFTELKPHIYFGGDSVAFWGPLCWTIIFGLGFGTFLTLILVPCMYLMAYAMKVRLRRRHILPPSITKEYVEEPAAADVSEMMV